MPEEASGTGQLLRAVLTGAGRRGVREFGRRVQVRAEGMRNDGRRRKRSAWFLGRLEMRAVVTRYALPESAPEAAALSDLLVGQLPTTVQLLTDTFDVTLRLQAADPYVLHYYADGRPNGPPGGAAAATASLEQMRSARRGDLGRIRAVFEENGCVELISAWDNLVGCPASDVVLRQLLASLARAWQGPGTTWVRTTMAASSLARVIYRQWQHRPTEALDGLQVMLNRVDVLHPDQ